MFKKLFARRPAPNLHEPWQLETEAAVPRQLVILRPKAPLLQWLKQATPDCASTLAELRVDATAYLVPMGEGDAAEARAFVDAHFGRFFAQELASWTTDPSQWPDERSLALFRGWFDIEIIDMVLDVAAA